MGRLHPVPQPDQKACKGQVDQGTKGADPQARRRSGRGIVEGERQRRTQKDHLPRGKSRKGFYKEIETKKPKNCKLTLCPRTLDDETCAKWFFNHRSNSNL